MTRLTGATELFGHSFISVCLPFHFIMAIILYTQVVYRVVDEYHSYFTQKQCTVIGTVKNFIVTSPAFWANS